ncbi:MAG TPA: hypothetical protein VNW99_09500 [Cytophagaceae bacterium]|nr:hypothetical protein [Cytophagaceae bacterium]
MKLLVYEMIYNIENQFLVIISLKGWFPRTHLIRSSSDDSPGFLKKDQMLQSSDEWVKFRSKV